MRKQALGKTKTRLLSVVLGLFFVSCAHTNSENERKPNSIAAATEIAAEQPAIKTATPLHSAQHALTEKLFAEKIKYQVCNNEVKNYLEDKMSVLPSDYLKIETTTMPNRLPVQCIQTAQRLHGGTYAVCDNENAKPKISYIKPCQSEAYLSLVYNAYHDVMDCFDVNPKEMFYQIMVESGFHINAINRSGFDSGMAQFTANGIKRVENLINYTQRILLESSRPSCQRISSVVGYFESGSTAVKNRCVMIDPPKNPYRSMLFAYLHTRRDQISMDKMIASIPEITNAVTDKIKRQFTFFSYNRGMTGLKNLLLGYVENRRRLNLPIAEKDLDLTESQAPVKKKLSADPSKRTKLLKAKIKNLSFAQYVVIRGSTYMSDMAEMRDYVERYYGKSCGEF